MSRQSRRCEKTREERRLCLRRNGGVEIFSWVPRLLAWLYRTTLVPEKVSLSSGSNEITSTIVGPKQMVRSKQHYGHLTLGIGERIGKQQSKKGCISNRHRSVQTVMQAVDHTTPTLLRPPGESHLLGAVTRLSRVETFVADDADSEAYGVDGRKMIKCLAKEFVLTVLTSMRIRGRVERKVSDCRNRTRRTDE